MMTESEFLRVFTIGLATGFLLGVVAAGYAALWFRERREAAGFEARARVTDTMPWRLVATLHRRMPA
jgi:hypothetical protein